MSIIKKISVVLCAAVIGLSMMPILAQETNAASLPKLSDKNIYYLGDNVGGQLCLVSSNTFMIKRKAILMGSLTWSSITLDEINAQGIRYQEYSYTNDGITYHAPKYTKFKTQGDLTGIANQLASLLSTRPEGVIIFGQEAQDNDLAAGKAADHGILIIEYKNGVFYGIDPSHNRNGKSEGIEPLSETTIVTLNGITHYMCFDKVTGTSDSAKVSTLNISDYRYPNSIVSGAGFTIKGAVKSNYSIKNVTVEILNSNDEAVISESSTPNSTSYNIKELDDSIKFGLLSPGTYQYQVTASDLQKTAVLVDKSFSVLAPSKLVVSGVNYPKTLKKGKAYSIKGTVKSNINLKKVFVGVYTTSGKKKYSGTKSLSGKKSYSIKGLDNKIKFGKLKKGTYYYKISAQDTQRSLVLLNKKFTVK